MKPFNYSVLVILNMSYIHTETNFSFEHEYPKLVRDLIPQIVKEDRGIDPEIEVIGDDEDFFRALLKKILEETQELSHVSSDTHLKEELADCFEVIDAILKLKGWTREDIAAVQLEKRGKRGGFDKRLLMMKKP